MRSRVSSPVFFISIFAYLWKKSTMSQCCKNTFILPETVGTCPEDTVTLKGKATQAGAHTLKINFLRYELRHVKTFEVGEDFIFPTHGLNENFAFIAQIEQPDKTNFVFVENLVSYDCFAFQTKIKINL